MQKVVFALAIAALLSLSGINSQFLAPPADAAAVDYYLKLGDIKGESTDSKHKDWIDVESFSFGVSRSGGSGGGGAGKASFAAVSLVKTIDKSSPNLFVESASGKHFATAELVLVKSGSEVMRWTLSDVLISSYQVNGGDAVPTEQFSLNYAKIVAEYSSSAGPIKMGWDVKTNKRV
ncbi:MAG: type VI secretion system tube protein Hcp [Candidatus Nitrosotenuis sp.]